MKYLSVKNWSKFQHYRDRNPPWIKLHRTLLDDYDFGCLHDASKLHLILIWLLASQSEGRIPDDPGFLQKKLGLKAKPDLKYLMNHGFLISVPDASKALALDASNLHLETEAETYKEETEKKARKRAKTPLPEDFKISERVKTWAQENGFTDLEPDLEFFIGRNRASGKTYADWDQAFMNCIREDWPGLRKEKR